jgi:hypothetical protein
VVAVFESPAPGRADRYARTSDPSTTTGHAVGDLLPLAAAVSLGLVAPAEALAALEALPAPPPGWTPPGALAELLAAAAGEVF